MLFFDFLYYSIYRFYAGYKEKGAESTSVSIVAGLQTLNVITVMVLIQSFGDKKVYINKILVVGIFLIFEIYNYRRYLYQEKYAAKAIEVKWQKKPESVRQRTKFLLVLYGVISVIACFALAIFIGSLR